MNKTNKTLIALAAMLGTTVASFGGLIGENYFGAGIGYTQSNFSVSPDLDGWGIGAQVNHNLSNDGNIGFDVGGSYAYSRISGSGFRARGHDLGVNAKAFSQMDNLKPYIGLHTGWLWANMRGWGKNNSWYYGTEGGVELDLGNGFSLTPNVSLTRIHKRAMRDTIWSFGVNAHKWFNDNMGAGIGYSTTDGPDRTHSVMAAFTIRY